MRLFTKSNPREFSSNAKAQGRREHGQRRKASRRPDKNAGSVFEQRKALARLRAHLRYEVRNRAGRAGHGLAFASFRTVRVP
ncbi:hypothetical protein FD733_05040 [Pantoea sp. Eser]|nr:hypothetical protein [Pantoea sp. Eser]